MKLDSTIAGGEGSQLVAVLNQRDLDGLTDAGVGLFSQFQPSMTMPLPEWTPQAGRAWREI